MPSRPRDVLGRLPLLLAILALALNDHVLKTTWPGLLTGKLSDFAGLFAFPLVVWGGVDLLAGPRARARLPLLGALALLTVASFALLKTSSSARALYVDAYAAFGWPTAVAPDLTDLACLPMPLLAWAYGVWHLQRPSAALVPSLIRASRTATVAGFCVLTVATSVPPVAVSTRPRLEAREGTLLHVTTDARLYTDRPFEVTLPGGAYRRITLVARDRGREHHDEQAEVAVIVVEELTAGDPRLDASPVRLSFSPRVLSGWDPTQALPSLLVPGASAPRDLQLQVEDDAGHVSRFDLSFEAEPHR